MRMYLSSFRMGDRPEHLVELLDAPGPVAVIANALDGASDDVRREGVERELGALAELGLGAEELDLRDYFGARERLAAELPRYRLVWVRGGNTFMLRHALAVSGAGAPTAYLHTRMGRYFGRGGACSHESAARPSSRREFRPSARDAF